MITAPIIGITTYGRAEKAVLSDDYDSYYVMPTDFTDAVRRAGGVPVLLPPGEAHIERWLDIVDGVIVTGGTDIDPARYSDEFANSNVLPANAERDESEITLVQRLINRRDIPVLLVCRGIQILNVALGGTLIQHIADLHPENIHQGKGTIWTIQEQSALPNSLLAFATGRDRFAAMSGHHQGVDQIGQGLIATSYAPDGIVEALEHVDHPFCLGVQWHPELTAATDQTQQAIFDALVSAACENHANLPDAVTRLHHRRNTDAIPA